ncbi:MAG TPA: hypothetical protein VFC53_07860 [Dehalococcoidia bacterium]|nr:hypothetical protein [Dehalococcoidia bacterium]
MIIIAGSGRSGTSAVAKLLHTAGIRVGRDLIEPDAGNPDGYFEERAVVRVNESILHDAGLDGWFSTASRARVREASRPHRDVMRALVRDATPAWKDPRFCWTLEAWLEVLPADPRVIVCLRSPAEVVASTLHYYGLAGDEPRRAIEHLWRAEHARLLDVIRDHRLDATSVAYAALHGAGARAEIAALSRFAGRPLDPAGVRRDLRHHAAPVAPEFATLYDAVRSLSAPYRAPARRAAGR